MQKPQLPDQIAADLPDRLRARFAQFGVVEGWGLEIVEMGPGRALLKIRANARTSNPGGEIINGGVLAASIYGMGFDRATELTPRVEPLFPLFAAAMNLVLIADDAYVFMVVWETMAFSSFFLVMANLVIPSLLT